MTTVRFVGVKYAAATRLTSALFTLSNSAKYALIDASLPVSARNVDAVVAVLSAVDSCAAKLYFTCDSTSASVLSSTPSRAMRAISSWIAFST